MYDASLTVQWHLKMLVYWWHKFDGCCLDCPYGAVVCNGKFAADLLSERAEFLEYDVIDRWLYYENSRDIDTFKPNL